MTEISNKIRVMHVITRMDMGGSAQNTLLSCIGLAGKCRIMLVFGGSKESAMTDDERNRVEQGLSLARDKGVVTVRLDCLVRRIDPVKDMLAFFSLFRLMRRHRPDIVHTHTSKAGIIGRLAARAARVPQIIHTPHGHVFFGHFGTQASRFFLMAEKIVEPATDCIVALTNGEMADYLSLSLTAPEKMRVIHSGVDVADFSARRTDPSSAREALGLPANALVVGTVGWLLPIKGPDILMSAMEKVWKSREDIYLVYVGKGELEPILRGRAQKTGVCQKVVFAGWRKDVADVLSAFDIFVLSSRNEGMGRVIVEAMAAGKPVVASRVGGIPDLVKHGVNGFLVPPEDPEALGEEILRLAADPELRNAMGAAGKRLAPSYDISSMVEKLDVLYQEVVVNS
ncbi:MAG: glycosyltransferase family 4 protein [Deltaproteobacteria bacterium]|nr:glycosyltransferase family 4 protein [Deltaproteobacteria bacterium]